jgi:hypothetical protein
MLNICEVRNCQKLFTGLNVLLDNHFYVKIIILNLKSAIMSAIVREILLILHILGLTLGVGVSFAYLFLGLSRKKMDPEDAKKDAVRSLSLSLMGDLGILLLIGSGLFLMKPYWAVLSTMPLLVAKLSFVAVLIILLLIIKINVAGIKKGHVGKRASIIQKLGKITLPLGIIIIILAVLTFK